jgi:dTDP-4-amino-4,6-dideoxygalactose transaminase
LKTLNACGDGGVVTGNDPALEERLRVFRNLGLQTRDNCIAWSGNSRLDSIQAAILLVKLRYLADWTSARRSNAAFYQRALTGVRGVYMPEERPHERPVYHTFVIQAERRDDLKRHLFNRGIETAIHYPVPIHLQQAAAELRQPPGSFPVAERQAQRILSLPVHPELSREQLQLVVDAVREFYELEPEGR